MKPTSLTLLFITFGLVACAGQPTPLPAASPSPVPQPTLTPFVPVLPTPTTPPVVKPTPTATTLAQAAILAQWQSGPHGDTYDLGKGPNTYCAHCHSPRNWDPAAKVDAPPNCVSCKFPTDATVRVAKSNPLVAQADWRDIGCDVCHQVENGVAGQQIVWFDKATGSYAAVANSTALCEHCHTDTDVLRHHIDMGIGPHSGFQCTQCHDPHSTKASCTSAQCHPAMSKVAGHDATHANVGCSACHDASGLQVGPDNMTKMWTTWQTTEVIGRKTTAAFVSHNLQKTVDCARCHFPGNSWNLSGAVRTTP